MPKRFEAANPNLRAVYRRRIVVSVHEIQPSSNLALQRKVIGEPTGGEVLKGKANATENGDLSGVLAAFLDAGDYFSKLCMYRFGAQSGSPDCAHLDGKFPVVHYNYRLLQGIGRDFALSG